MNFIDIQLRNGSYPLPTLPTALGVEAAGTIVALPTDEAVLTNEAFKMRGFEVGGKATFVSRTPSTGIPQQPIDTLTTVIPPTVQSSERDARRIHGRRLALRHPSPADSPAPRRRCEPRAGPDRADVRVRGVRRAAGGPRARAHRRGRARAVARTGVQAARGGRHRDDEHGGEGGGRAVVWGGPCCSVPR